MGSVPVSNGIPEQTFTVRLPVELQHATTIKHGLVTTIRVLHRIQFLDQFIFALSHFQHSDLEHLTLEIVYVVMGEDVHHQIEDA